uniref:Uncharacterized protein n=1 Tax=Caenorhabditis japonica TaxID=281687 RepID=A0A8R1IDX3_CAEJA
MHTFTKPPESAHIIGGPQPAAMQMRSTEFRRRNGPLKTKHGRITSKSFENQEEWILQQQQPNNNSPTTTTRRLENEHLETRHFETASTGKVKSEITCRVRGGTIGVFYYTLQMGSPNKLIWGRILHILIPSRVSWPYNRIFY